MATTVSKKSGAVQEKLLHGHFRNAVTTASQGERTPPGSGMSLFKEIDADPFGLFFRLNVASYSAI